MSARPGVFLFWANTVLVKRLLRGEENLRLALGQPVNYEIELM
jgi:hypothetical protein